MVGWMVGLAIVSSDISLELRVIYLKTGSKRGIYILAAGLGNKIGILPERLLPLREEP